MATLQDDDSIRAPARRKDDRGICEPCFERLAVSSFKAHKNVNYLPTLRILLDLLGRCLPCALLLLFLAHLFERVWDIKVVLLESQLNARRRHVGECAKHLHLE